MGKALHQMRRRMVSSQIEARGGRSPRSPRWSALRRATYDVVAGERAAVGRRGSARHKRRELLVRRLGSPARRHDVGEEPRRLGRPMACPKPCAENNLAGGVAEERRTRGTSRVWGDGEGAPRHRRRRALRPKRCPSKSLIMRAAARSRGRHGRPRAARPRGPRSQTRTVEPRQ